MKSIGMFTVVKVRNKFTVNTI